MKKLTKLMLMLAQLGLMSAVQAASVSLSPTSQQVVLASIDSVTFDVIVDFRDATTLGGTFQLSYTDSISILGAANFSLNDNFFSDNSLTASAPVVSSGLITQIGFDGTFGGTSLSIGTIGTLTFTPINTGLATVVTAADDDPFYWFLNPPGSSSDEVTYGSATAQVSAVPVPAALWLMASGLSALGLAMRRRRA